MDEQQLQHYVERLRDAPQHRKGQFFVQQLVRGWRPKKCSDTTNQQVVECFVDLVGAPEVVIRRKALQALGALGTNRRFDALIEAAIGRGLVDPDPSVRVDAAEAGFSLSVDGWRPGECRGLTDALGDALWTVRWFAAGALLFRGDAHAVGVLVDFAPPTRNSRWQWVVWHVIQQQPSTYEAFLPIFERMESASADDDDFDWQDWKQRVTLRDRRRAFFGRNIE